jgi:hypothetical protein
MKIYLAVPVVAFCALAHGPAQADVAGCDPSTTGADRGAICSPAVPLQSTTLGPANLHSLGGTTAGSTDAEAWLYRMAQGIAPSCPAGFHFSKGKCLPGAAPQAQPQVRPQAAPQVAPRAVPRPPIQAALPPMSPTVQAYVDRWNGQLEATGINWLAPHKLVVPSCPGCVPYIISCRDTFSGIEGLRGRRVRVSPDTERVVQQVGGIPILMPGGEIQAALNENRIDCLVAGGVVPR